jgi:hypothetical protein
MIFFHENLILVALSFSLVWHDHMIATRSCNAATGKNYGGDDQGKRDKVMRVYFQKKSNSGNMI